MKGLYSARPWCALCNARLVYDEATLDRDGKRLPVCARCRNNDKERDR